MMVRFFLHIMLLLCFPVSGFAAAVTSSIVPGLNVTGVTAELVTAQATAFPLLTVWKASGVSAIEAFDTVSGTMQRAELDSSGNPTGVNFPLVENSALHVYSTLPTTLSLGISISCAPLNLAAGFNLASYACFPANYLTSQYINAIGLSNVISISRLDVSSGRWQTAAVDAGTIVGEEFLLSAGEGYVVQAAVPVSGWSPTTLALTPTMLSVQQGQPGATLTVTIPGTAPVGGTQVALVSSDPTLVTVDAQVTVLQGNNSVSVPLTIPDTGSASVQSVTVTASLAGMTDTVATISVRPKPTVNLSPLTTLTGLTFTYLLNVNLSDVAPPGGFPVNLTAAPATVVNVPASITVPAGSSSTQVIVTATLVGSATITATSPGRGFSGTQNVVTVTPIQTVNYGPILTAPVGVTVTVPTAVTSLSATYKPLVSGQVGVVVGSAITGVTPATGSIGSTSLKISVAGIGLSAATAIAFEPATGITIQPGSFAVNGGNPEVIVDIDPTAPTTVRTALVSLPTGMATSGAPGADLFRVTLPEPQILSIQPIRAMTGQMVTLTVFGKNLTAASSIDFIPATGISINNLPTVNAAGDTATVLVNISAGASLGNRVVTITTPGWTSSATASVANTFLITAEAGTTYKPLVSREVGVLVTPPVAATTQSVTYGPVISGQVGVVVGSTITGVIPATGAIGSTSLKVTVAGVGLSSATAIAFEPATGITIQSGSFAVNGGNPEVTIDIDPAAPLNVRTVLVTLPSGIAMSGAPGANQFRVTLPEPQILSIQPIRSMVGQSVSLNVFGKNFTSASSIDFSPGTGISINNPPTINATGDMATVTVNIAANAPLGSRVVTISTPGWTSTANASVANSFQITADAGTTYTPLISREVGVMVSQPPAVSSLNVNYGPVVSGEVGIMVTVPAAVNQQNVTYSPIISSQIGVAVGGVLTGVGPLTVEPGTTTSVTLTGTDLTSVTAISVVPATGITVGTWAPASDGLSGTVLITTDVTIQAGPKTVIVSTASGAITPAVPGAGILLVGYKPGVNSISPILPTVGTTFTLTINGTHLQGTSKVAILPSDNVAIDSQPVWTSDATGEHLTVTVIIDSAALPGDRVVVITTSYGVTALVGSPANTITFFKPGIVQLKQPQSQSVAVAYAESLYDEPVEALRGHQNHDTARISQREKPTVHYAVALAHSALDWKLAVIHEASRLAPQNTNGYLYAGYRGPPGYSEHEKI